MLSNYHYIIYIDINAIYYFFRITINDKFEFYLNNDSLYIL